MAKIELITSNGKISLDYSTDNSMWCKVNLVSNNSVYLGASSLDRIRDGFLNALRPEKRKKTFSYKEKELFTVVTLMETCFVLAARYIGEHVLELNFLDKDGNFLSPMILQENDISQWISELETLDF